MTLKNMSYAFFYNRNFICIHEISNSYMFTSALQYNTGKCAGVVFRKISLLNTFLSLINTAGDNKNT